MKLSSLSLFFFFILILPLASAVDDFGYDNPTLPSIPSPEVDLTPVIGNSTNTSLFWDGIRFPNATQMETTNSTLSIRESWFITLWNAIFDTKTTDDLAEGSTNFYDNRTWNETHASGLYAPNTTLGVQSLLNFTGIYSTYNTTYEAINTTFNIQSLINNSINHSAWWGNPRPVSSWVQDWFKQTGTELDFNDTKLATIYYNASQSSVTTGTINGGTLADTEHNDGRYDSKTFNFTEAAGAPGLDVRINFTGIPDFNLGVMRYKTGSLAGAYPLIQLWNYDGSVWEDYPAVGESESFATITQPVFDSADHISGGVVQMRLYKASNGNINNHYYVDWIAIAEGFGTPAGEEVDPFSVHRDGSTTLSANWDVGDFNITDLNWLDAEYGNFSNVCIGSVCVNSWTSFNETALIEAVNTTANIQNLLNFTGIYSTPLTINTTKNIQNLLNSTGIYSTANSTYDAYSYNVSLNYTERVYDNWNDAWSSTANSTYDAINTTANIQNLINGTSDALTLNGKLDSHFMPDNTSVVGSFDFNGGWASEGLSIIDGDIYAQTGYFYNISGLDVSNLNINGSLLPAEGFDDTFDLGESALRWQNLYLSGGFFVADWSNVSGNQIANDLNWLNRTQNDLLFNQTDLIGAVNTTANLQGLLNNSYVPYVGATGNVDLGKNNLSLGNNITFASGAGIISYETGNVFTFNRGVYFDSFVDITTLLEVGTYLTTGTYAEIGTYLEVNGYTELGGDLNATEDVYIFGDTEFNGTIIPMETLTWDLGSGAKRLRVGYFQNISADEIATSGNIVALGNITTEDYFVGDGKYISNLNISGNFSSITSTASWNRSGTNVFTHNPGDNVGIGTASPSQELHIESSSNPGVKLNSTANDEFWILQTIGSVVGQEGTLRIQEATSGGAGTVMTFQNKTGNVGIGTTSPDTLLTIKGGAGADNHIKLVANDDGNVMLFGKDAGENAFLNMYDTAGNVDVKLSTIGDNYIMGQNVGIGTASPGVALDVTGRIRANTTSQVAPSSGTGLELFHLTSTDSTYIIPVDRTSASDDLKPLLAYGKNISFVTGNSLADDSVKMFINTTGNVGIGTTSITSDGFFDPKLVIASPDDSTKWIGMGFNDSLDVGFIYAVDTLTSWKDLVLQPVSGNVGIGTASPDTLLQVNGTTTIGESDNLDKHLIFQGGGGASSVGIRFQRDAAIDGSITIDDVEDLIINYGQSDLAGRELIIKNGSAGTVTAIFDDAGNVGIGTASPARKLEVMQGTTDPSFRLSYDANYYLDQNYRSILMTAPVASSNDLKIGVESTPTGAGQGISFLTSNTSRMYVDDTGNVGIGTVSPGAKLDVADVNLTKLRITSTKAGTWVVGEQLGALEFYGSDGSGPGAQVKAEIGVPVINTFGDDFDMTFKITNSTGTLVELMRIEQTGSVGIGTTNPDAKLEIFQNGTYNSEITAAISIDDGTADTGLLLGADAANDIAFIQSLDPGTSFATRNLAINPNGANVGIGTTAPAGKLDVTTSDGSPQAYIQSYDNGAGSANLNFRKSDTDTIGSAVQTDNGDILGQIKFWGVDSSPAFDQGAQIRAIQDGASSTTVPTNLVLTTWSSTAENTNQLVLHNDGNIGIGTGSPSTRSGYGAPWLTLASAATGIAFIDTNAANNANFMSSNGGQLQFGKMNDDGTAESIFMTIQNDGDVGIGTASPTAPLHIFSTTVPQFIINYSTTEHFAIQKGTGGARFIINNVDPAIFIQDDGFIGIGTASPNSKLEVVGDGLSLNVSGVLYVNESSRNVGIGTASPGGLLHIFEADSSATASTAANELVIEGTGALGTGLSILTDDAKSSNIYLGSTTDNSGGFLRWVYDNAQFDIGTSLANANLTFSTATDSELMRLTGGGNVGIGTTSPAAKLDVYTTTGDAIWGISYGVDGTGVFGESNGTNGEGIYGYATGSGGTGTYGWSTGNAGIGVWGDATGYYGWGVHGWSNGTEGRGVSGEGTGSNSWGVYGLSTGNIGDGVVGHATGNDGTGVYGYNNGTTGEAILGYATGVGGVAGWFASDNGDGVVSDGASGSCDFDAVGPGTNYCTSSSLRFKDESTIKLIDSPLDKVLALRGVTYNFSEEYGGKFDMGMIAEEVGEIVPEVVAFDEFGIARAMDYGALTPLLVEAIKEQQTQIDAMSESLCKLGETEWC